MRLFHRRGAARIIGLMSGTSHDGVDAVLVEIRKAARRDSKRPAQGPLSIKPLVHFHAAYSRQLREKIRKAFDGNTGLVCSLNFELGEVFASAVLTLLKTSGFRPEDIDAVASHGQTVFHIPPSGRRPGSTLQIGEAAVIAERTGIPVISDFRTRDMAAGGHGAPLVPLADYLLFKKPGKVTAVLNIGGMANVTILRGGIKDTVAFDTGPGNSLIDEAVRLYSGGRMSFDKDGCIAESGRLSERFLSRLLKHPYFKKKHPKSTGRETFGSDMVRDIFLSHPALLPEDIILTLTYLTAITIRDSVAGFRPDEVVVTGGGTKNRFLMKLITGMFADRGIAVNSISDYGISPEAKEALSFALLGYKTMEGGHGNIPSATGAGHGVVLGKITPGQRGCTKGPQAGQ